MDEPVLGGMVQSESDRIDPMLRAGNTNCGGCGMSSVLQMLGRAAAQQPIQLVIPACCGIVTAGAYPCSAYGAPTLAATFASAAAMATGLAQCAAMNGEDTRVCCFAGDGGTFDIGMATLSASAERNEDLLYICYDNEIYGNTGGQRSSATPRGASTTTTPKGNTVAKKDVLGIIAAHDVPYLATISIAHPEDALRKLRTALKTRGFRFLHALSPCPTGWKSEPADGLELVRLAVRSGLYPVYEMIDGERVINVEPEHDADALARYFTLQGRFRKATIDFDAVKADIARMWRKLGR